MKPRKPIRRKKAVRRSWIKPSRKPMKQKNVDRKKREFARCYGSKERVEWINAKPCCWCGVSGYTENAHTEGGGAGRKADAETIAPLCGDRYPQQGCHGAYDRHQGPFCGDTERAFVKECAADCASEWNAR